MPSFVNAVSARNTRKNHNRKPVKAPKPAASVPEPVEPVIDHEAVQEAAAIIVDEQVLDEKDHNLEFWRNELERELIMVTGSITHRDAEEYLMANDYVVDALYMRYLKAVVIQEHYENCWIHDQAFEAPKALSETAVLAIREIPNVLANHEGIHAFYTGKPAPQDKSFLTVTVAVFAVCAVILLILGS